jgi:broad specificity phosphatase PhoE
MVKQPAMLRKDFKVAERLKDIPLQAIWSSPMRRAQHTAEIINQYHHVPIIEKANLREIKRATVLEGKLPSDPSIAQIRLQLWEHINDPYFRHEDSESFADLVHRVGLIQKDLENYSEASAPMGTASDLHLCLTAHGIVLSTLLFHLILGASSSPEILREAITHTRMENTGISIAEYAQAEWRVLTFSDFAHL